METDKPHNKYRIDTSPPHLYIDLIGIKNYDNPYDNQIINYQNLKCL